MRIPETPASVSQLDLMKRLEDYAENRATWYGDQKPLGESARKACRAFHTHIVSIVEQVFAFIMDRSTAREMDTFTMHDRVHGRKVAHLMWHILLPERREVLTPPEIGMLVLAAHLHDAGMALSRSEREARLSPDADLWDRVEANPSVKKNLNRLREILKDTSLAEPKRLRAEGELFQAEEALLALDTRERHASSERYEELIGQVRGYHDKDRARIPDIEECLSFNGDSFKGKLIDICVSHNQDAGVLVEKDLQHFDSNRFPREYPVGLALANTHLIASALRLADVLDFDRERTPPTLFHYLVPTTLSHGVSISALEWNKHLSISSWEIGQSATVFRGRCTNHIVHHAVVQFGRAIEEEIASTRATFEVTGASWPFALPSLVKVDIHEDGYHYLPYRFQLDDARVYELLMGGAIYDKPLVAVRELVQNAVDACSYRDALSKLAESHVQPDTKKRITVRYEEPAGEKEYPTLRVMDTGTGMDAWVLERWFLKVGRSFYNSTEFAQDRVQMRRSGVDFAPVSEFGIGFLSSFLLADRVELETAMWEPVRGDIRKRHLEIDGPTRLIRIRENANTGIQRFKGTNVSLTLVRGGRRTTDATPVPPSWDEVKAYLEEVCQDLPYRLNLEYVTTANTVVEFIDPKPMTVDIPAHYATTVFRIPVSDVINGCEGEVAIVPYFSAQEVQRERLKESAIEITPEEEARRNRGNSVLLRGGFNIGEVPGLPEAWGHGLIRARLRLLWHGEDRRYSSTNLARTGAVNEETLGSKVTEIWLRYLLDHQDELPEGFMYGIDIASRFRYRARNRPFADRVFFLTEQRWLEEYSALSLYTLARNGWHYLLQDKEKSVDPVPEWESGKNAAETIGVGLIELLHKIILPHVAPERTLNDRGDLFVMPPIPGWRERLGSCGDFISKPVQWSRIVFFSGRIADHVYRSSLGGPFFNHKYADRLSGFSENDLNLASRVFDKLLSDRDDHRPSQLNAQEGAILDRAVASVGDLEISSGSYGIHRLDSFRGR